MSDALALAKARREARSGSVAYAVMQRILTFLKYFILVFVAFWMVVPLASCFVTAAKTKEEYESTSVMTMPKNWLNFDNYVQAFKTSNMVRTYAPAA